jgi:exodeoxyribonuclease V alpha subunit
VKALGAALGPRSQHTLPHGCEYPAVVIPLTLAHARMLGRNLIYTAVTRAQRRVVLIGESRALEQAVSNIGGMQRLTHLARRLRAALAPPPWPE